MWNSTRIAHYFIYMHVRVQLYMAFELIQLHYHLNNS